MKSLWVRAILPLMVVSLTVACGSGDSGTPAARGSTPEQTEPPVVNQNENKELELPQNGNTDSTKPNLDEQGGEGSVDPQSDLQKIDQQYVDIEKLRADAALYTGASSDYLRTYFTELTELPNKSKGRDLELAGSIENAKARVDQETGQALITIKFRDDKNAVQFAGPMRSTGIASTSSASRKNTDVDMICLDENPNHCFVSVLRIKTDGRKGAVSYVLIRHTNANVGIKLPDSYVGSSAFVKFVNMFSNTMEKNNVSIALKTILVESFEVIGGASGVKVAILNRDHQLITATGPLIKIDDRIDGDTVNMTREMNLADLIDLEKGRGFKTEMQESISNIEMVKNDGLGNFSLFFTFASDSKSPERHFTVGIERTEVRVLPMKDLNRIFEVGSRD